MLRKIFGTPSDRYIKTLKPLIQKITSQEKAIAQLSDKDLKQRTPWLQERLAKGESLDAILPDAFATIREAARRVLGLFPYEVQLVGGIALHYGQIAEMRTGEGKTLAATLPVYLNALNGKGVHVVTVNDYLAFRDSQWMGKIYSFLGLRTSCVLHHMNDEERQNAYAADITYATNSELGFDYLRDNMKTSQEERVVRPFSYAIVDEVDSILIDEARTPLIISGPAEKSSALYEKVDALVAQLETSDYEKDEKGKSITLSETGMPRMEAIVSQAGLMKGSGLYEDVNITLVHHINQALKARMMFTRDVDYIVRNNKVMLVDEFTGRIMDGRRYSDGLHQALEAKEKVPVEIENQTLASITYQNFFRLYPKLAGMTGTALTDAEEFQAIYKLNVIAIPTNKPVQRRDHDDAVYRTFAEKCDAILELLREIQKRKQPVLLGTVSIEKSELFSRLLTQNGMKHKVLNARHHEQEAEIIAEAGAPGAITIATNMAGRGTDIKLGGNLDMRLEKALLGIEDKAQKEKITEKTRAQYEKDRQAVLESGGLFILGTERHESRRIDNQLRGRAGRQGDPGASKFFLSLQDDLMRIFGSETLDAWLVKLGLKEGEAITHPWINKALEKAQGRVEARNFDTRKHLLKYDNIMSAQRKIVYGWRQEVVNDPKEAEGQIRNQIQAIAAEWTQAYAPEGSYANEWDRQALEKMLTVTTGRTLPALPDDATTKILQKTLESELAAAYEAAKASHEQDQWPELVGQITLQAIDQNWKDHLYALDQIRQGVHLRSYAQKDPLNEYASEAFRLFQSFLEETARQTLQALLTMQVLKDDETLIQALASRDPIPENSLTHEAPKTLAQQPTQSHTSHMTASSGTATVEAPLSRNASCPCGSGKRYKNCHGKLMKTSSKQKDSL